MQIQFFNCRLSLQHASERTCNQLDDRATQATQNFGSLIINWAQGLLRYSRCRTSTVQIHSGKDSKIDQDQSAFFSSFLLSSDAFAASSASCLITSSPVKSPFAHFSNVSLNFVASGYVKCKSNGGKSLQQHFRAIIALTLRICESKGEKLISLFDNSSFRILAPIRREVRESTITSRVRLQFQASCQRMIGSDSQSLLRSHQDTNFARDLVPQEPYIPSSSLLPFLSWFVESKYLCSPMP